MRPTDRAHRGGQAGPSLQWGSAAMVGEVPHVSLLWEVESGVPVCKAVRSSVAPCKSWRESG